MYKKFPNYLKNLEILKLFKKQFKAFFIQWMNTCPIRPKNRWEDDIINDMKKLKIKNWTSCIQDRNKWKLYVEKDKTIEE